MSKSKKGKGYYDYTFGLSRLTPSKQGEKDNTQIVQHFSEEVSTHLMRQAAELKACGFPAENEVLVGIIQFFSSPNEYKKRDVDNISKTILDAMIGTIYQDDGQVRSILVSKRHSSKVKENFVFVGIKHVNGETDVGIVHEHLYEQAVSMYNVICASR